MTERPALNYIEDLASADDATLLAALGVLFADEPGDVTGDHDSVQVP